MKPQKTQKVNIMQSLNKFKIKYEIKNFHYVMATIQYEILLATFNT